MHILKYVAEHAPLGVSMKSIQAFEELKVRPMGASRATNALPAYARPNAGNARNAGTAEDCFVFSFVDLLPEPPVRIKCMTVLEHAQIMADVTW